MKKILLIKLGYSETLDSLLSMNTSLGDVLRTTVILHFFKEEHVSWLVDEKARPLLENNKYIRRILIYNPRTVSQLRKEKFDIIINFEKIPDICRFSDSLIARKRFGFKLDMHAGKPGKCSQGENKFFALTQDLRKKKENTECWQKIMAGLLGKKWRKEEYILGYRASSKVKYDIGFNWTTGNKWENKAWPKGHWKKLESLLKDEYSISWQQGLGSIYEYIDWINSCRLIVTADTLGLHLALTLKKRVVALFGPTSYSEIYFYDCGSALLPESPYDCIPCLKPRCAKKRLCMGYITPERVKERIENELERSTVTRKI